MSQQIEKSNEQQLRDLQMQRQRQQEEEAKRRQMMQMNNHFAPV
jgi:hypothetical protein